MSTLDVLNYVHCENPTTESISPTGHFGTDNDNDGKMLTSFDSVSSHSKNGSLCADDLLSQSSDVI